MLDLIEYPLRTVLAPAQTAAGAGVTVAMPESERQVAVAVAFRIVTSAVVATRVPRVTITDGSGVIIAGSVAGVTSAASLTTDYIFAVGGDAWTGAAGAVVSGPFPTVPMDAGDSLVISAALLDAGDQISRVRVTLLQVPVRDDDA